MEKASVENFDGSLCDDSFLCVKNILIIEMKLLLLLNWYINIWRIFKTNSVYSVSCDIVCTYPGTIK